MKYNTHIETLEDFYQTLYSIPARLTREIANPRSVTQKLLKKLGSPHKSIRSILVTGSKGKGSSAIMLSSLLKEANLRIGMFSSPHLFDYRERIVINGKMINQRDLLHLAKRVFAVANDLEISYPDEFPRFFEITTAIAYLYFHKKRVDYAVIEAGIGALTDATNQDSHCLSILTNIEYEHLDIFENLKSIAVEKSGVMREGVPLILGDLPKNISQLILNHATQLHVPLTRFKNKFITNNKGFYPFVIGSHVWISDSKSKAKNAWIALNAFDKLGEKLTDGKKVKALNNVLLPAREEIVSKEPLVIIDSAHTQISAKSLSNYVKKVMPPVVRKQILLVSFSAKKNIRPVMSAFPNVDKIIITRASDSRSLLTETVLLSIEELTFFSKKPKIKLIKDPLIALQKTMKKLQKDDILVITGSVYLAGLLSQQFRQ